LSTPVAGSPFFRHISPPGGSILITLTIAISTISSSTYPLERVIRAGVYLTIVGVRPQLGPSRLLPRSVRGCSTDLRRSELQLSDEPS
jgi:hypothetical protein